MMFSTAYGIMEVYKTGVPAALVAPRYLVDSHRRATDVSDHTPPKRCTQCGESKPATTEYFVRQKSARDGLCAMCKTCKQSRNRAWRAANADTLNARRRDLSPERREQINADCRDWRARNRERVLIGKRKFYWANREQEQAKSRAWLAENREWKRQYDKAYSRRNRATIRARQRRWEDQNRERINASRRPLRVIYQRAREAMIRDLPIKFTAQDWARALAHFGGGCAVCGRPPGLFHGLAKDHWIPISDPACPGTIPTNILPLCHGEGGCNNGKRNRDPGAWLIAKFGKAKASEIQARIAAYFEAVR